MKKKLLLTIREVTYHEDRPPTEKQHEAYTTPHASDARVVSAVKAAVGWEHVMCRKEILAGTLTLRPLNPRHHSVCWVTFEPYEGEKH